MDPVTSMKVVIVGAGPAGLITALNLLQRGISPLVLEKGSEVKSTACSEGCSHQSLSQIPFNSKPYISRVLKGVKLVFPDGAVYFVAKECAVLDRTAWLRGMAEEIRLRGGEIRLNSEVVDIDQHSLGLKNGEGIGYHVLIGADGPDSRIARHLGIKHRLIVASQYQLALDTSNMDYIEFYFDKKFGSGYPWIFPKVGVANVGIEGDFALLDAFLEYRGLDKQLIVKKESGLIPGSGIGKLVQQNIALIGDAASMPNPTSLSGLTPIICASQILASNINHLEAYQVQVKNHPMANPILLKPRQTLMSFSNHDLANVGRFLAEVKHGEEPYPKLMKIAKYHSLLLKLNKLRTIYEAGRITEDYGW